MGFSGGAPMDRECAWVEFGFQNSHDLVGATCRPLQALVGPQYSGSNRSGDAVEDHYSGAASLSGQGSDENDSAISNRIPEPFLRP